MKKQIFKTVGTVVGVVLLIVILGFVFYLVDNSRASKGLEPLFCVKTDTSENGKVQSYYGLGYKVVVYNNTDNEDSDVQVGSYFMDTDKVVIQAEIKDTFTGTIIEVKDNTLLIEVDKDQKIYNSSDKIHITVDQPNSYTVNERVKVGYNGVVLETYPAQVVPIQIERVSQEKVDKIALMYQTIIENIMNEDTALNNNALYLALDIHSFKRPIKAGEVYNVQNNENFPTIEESTKDAIINFCKRYNENIKIASFKDLKEQGLYNEERRGIEGLLLYAVNIEELEENKAKLELVKYKGGLAALFYTYELEYQNNQWNFQITNMAIS